MKRLFALGIMFLTVSDLSAWRAIGRYSLGSEANGIGGAYVGFAETELSVHYNPAGIAQIAGQWEFMYEVSTGIQSENLLNFNLKFYPDIFPFFSTVVSAGDLRLALSWSTLFDGYSHDSILVRSLKVTVAYPILKNLSVGAGFGPVFAFESSGIAYGWSANFGVLWKITEDFQIGACFHTAIAVNWVNPVSGSSLSETYPAVFDIGISWKAANTAILFASMEYIDITGIKYILNGVDHSPVFDSNLFSRLHPHLGVRFLEAFTGAHLSLGFMIDSEYFETGGINQYLFTIGVRAFAKNAVFHASIIDALLFSIFYPYNSSEERINIGVTFQIY
ncbi:MAG: hypothetical protein A2Y33_00310 [Spirochaetes bacterium GWF1_51_8]|nr:MAG: hypothetical protein A2Y33_00310 [Spirochaetes bacterium GWF1_51_8]